MNTKSAPSASEPQTNSDDAKTEPGVEQKTGRGVSSRRTAFLWLLAGTVFYWAALPPWGLWPLIFLVPILWAVMIEREASPGFLPVYVSALLFWLVSIWWISCPHPMTTVGLLALSAYLALFWPLFFATSRFAVRIWKVPTVLAAPICWTGCEWLRGHLLSGFSFCSMEHALYLQPRFIQIADIAGEYTVGAMVMLVGVGFGAPLLEILRPREFRKVDGKIPARVAFSSLLAVTVLLAAFFYGIGKLRRPVAEDVPKLHIAALQGNVPVRLGDDGTLARQTMKQYHELNIQAAMQASEEGRPLDLIVWPETVCFYPNVVFAGNIGPGDLDADEDLPRQLRDTLFRMARQIDTPVLLGLSTYLYENDAEPKRLNSGLLIHPREDEFIGRYDKVHLVMFGEYIPFSEYLPENFFLKTLCQEAGRGTRPVALPVGREGGENWMSVNICFESSVPHLVREQVLTLKKEGREPKLLVNISNDGWFRFSRQIDQHLATNVFRAVENRRPYVTATNGGFSALIDHCGRIQAIGRRGAAEAVLGTLALETETPPYHRLGDWPAFLCSVAVCLLLVLRFLFSRHVADVRPPRA